MKTTIGSNAKTKIKQALGLFVLALAPMLPAQQTYTWAGNGTSLWSNSNGWVGAPDPLIFNNQTDIIFDNDAVVGRSNAVSIGGARTIRSLSIGANYVGSSTATFDIQTTNTINNGNANLTFEAASGNASITLDQSTTGTIQVRLGRNNNGAIVLNSNLDIAQNNTSLDASGNGLQIETTLQGSGDINKTGAGLLRILRNNSAWTGNMNINEGAVQVGNDPGNAFGQGTWTLGGGANNTSLIVRKFFNDGVAANPGGIVVAAGAGNRTIANTAFDGGGILNLGGNITLNKDAIFDVASHVVTTGDRMTLSGNVTGTGGIVKTGTGILILSGTGNNYSGTTDIQAGKLFLGGAGRLGSGNVTISSGANLDFGTGASQVNVVTNNISGDGQIIQSTASTDTRITGNVTNTGGLTINGGTLRIGNGGTTGSYTGDTVITSGTLAFSRSNAYTHGGTISGAGGVSKVDAGDVTLTGNNSYTGLTHLFAGALVADHANALGTGDITFNSGGGNSGTIRYTANSAATDWATRIVNSAGTIRLDTNGNDVNLAGVIDDSNVYGLVKSGNGTLTLGGANTYIGATTVGAGGLIVGGSLASGSAVTVASGALIGGDGTIGGSLTLDNGAFLVFDPTLSLPLTVSGTFTLDSSFGVASLRNSEGGAIDWSSIGDSTYTLLDGAGLPTFSADNISNYGAGNAFDIGGGRSAYFENGSLALVVIPEPASLGLLVAGVAGLMALRRMTRF